jgi:hypothetical protein
LHSKRRQKLFWFIFLKMRIAIRLLFVANLVRNLCAIHANRVTIMQKDIQLARRIRGHYGGAAVY